MEGSNLIFTPSGIRGIAGKDLTLAIAKKIAIAYGLWLKPEDKKVIIGRDTRPSSEMIECSVIEGLIATGCEIIDVGMCPTPAIILAKNKLKIRAGVIISGSHNPPEWNALKLLSSKTFLSKTELNEISSLMNKVDLKNFDSFKKDLSESIENFDANSDYIQSLCNHFDVNKIKKNNNLKVAVDTGAGAGKIVTPQILEKLGCKVKIINNNLDEDKNFPREIEPIEKNLKDLIITVWKDKCDIGFAHDCDADRLAIIGDDFKCYPEDIGLALISRYYLEKHAKNYKKVVFVTNLASSLMFEALAEKYNAQVIRTSIGERYLAEKMYEIIEESCSELEKTIIFGGEGSCGGVMDPRFNMARDGIFAAAKIVEILVESGEKISELVSKLPRYFSSRENIDIMNADRDLILNQTKDELIKEGENFVQIDDDIRFGHGNEWFVLIHPSNTEPIIRVISEAKRESLARVYCETTAELIKMVISRH